MTINTLAVNGNLALGSGSGGSVLDFAYGNTGIDEITATSATLSGTSTINLTSLGTLPAGSYPLIAVSSGTLNASQFQLGVKPAGGFSSVYLSPSPTNNALLLTVSANATPGTAYWTGKGSLLTSDTANYWASGANAGSSNWSTDSQGQNDPFQVPGAVTNVIFTATNVAGSGALTTTLDQNYFINSLTFAVPAGTSITGVTVNTGSNSLSLGSGYISSGLTLNAASATGGTISGAGGIVVSGTQSGANNWANNSNTYNLAVNTPITSASGPTNLTLNGTGTGGVTFGANISNGNGQLALNFNQAGVTLLAASNSYSGGTTLTSGVLQLGNSAALPAGQALNVNGGTLDLAGFSQSVGVLAGGAAATIQSSGGAATLTAGAGTAGAAFYGTLKNGSGTLARTARTAPAC